MDVVAALMALMCKGQSIVAGTTPLRGITPHCVKCILFTEGINGQRMHIQSSNKPFTYIIMVSGLHNMTQMSVYYEALPQCCAHACLTEKSTWAVIRAALQLQNVVQKIRKHVCGTKLLVCTLRTQRTLPNVLLALSNQCARHPAQ